MKFNLSLLTLIVLVTACANDPIPKPPAYLRLEYPEASYYDIDLELPFKFEANVLASKVKVSSLEIEEGSLGATLEYPIIKGTIYLTYKEINNDSIRLVSLLRDAQNFTQKHTVKADEITEQLFESKIKNVYGMFYEVGGNAASQSQFYVTDSLNHFITGSLYFYAKPNYDSILPAAHYLQKDIKHIMETIEWK